MNSASQNFAHHLSVLRERMLHPTAYETADQLAQAALQGCLPLLFGHRAKLFFKNPRILSLLAKRSDDSRTGRVAAEEMPYPHDFPGINKRVGNRVRLRLLNSGGESLGKCMHGCGLTTQAQGPGAR